MTADTKAPAKSWYDTGYGGVRREQERIEQGSGPNRLWMPAGAKKEVVFVDDEPVCIHEHNPKMNGEWTNWFTCLKDVYEDVACCEILNPSGYKPYYVGFYTCIDCSEYIDKKGNKYQYEMKLFPAKLKTLKRLQMRRTERGPFAGKLFSIMRVDDKSPSSGDEFEIIRETVDWAKLFPLANYKGKKIGEWFAKGVDEESIKSLSNIWKLEVTEGKIQPKLVPFNYFQILHPLPPKDIRAILSGSQIEKKEHEGGGTAGSSGPSSSADESVPF